MDTIITSISARLVPFLDAPVSVRTCASFAKSIVAKEMLFFIVLRSDRAERLLRVRDEAEALRVGEPQDQETICCICSRDEGFHANDGVNGIGTPKPFNQKDSDQVAAGEPNAPEQDHPSDDAMVNMASSMASIFQDEKNNVESFVVQSVAKSEKEDRTDWADLQSVFQQSFDRALSSFQ